MQRLLSLIVLLTLPVWVFAQTNQPLETWCEKADAVLSDQMVKQKLVGACIGVIREGEIVCLQYQGFEDAENKIPVTDQTKFRWASVSKPLTAIAALQLVEQGKLDLQADVRTYVPEFPDHGHPISVRDLMCHQSGIVHYRNGKVIPTRRDYPMPHPYEDVVLALDTFRESPLVHPPGEKFSYSTHAYILLSAVVQNAGDQKFVDQVRERVIAPLNLSTLEPDYQWKDISHRAVGYARHPLKGSIQVSSNTDVSWKLGGGGYLSSIEDMAQFAIGLMGDELIRPETKKKMWTRQKLSNGKVTQMGLGVYVTKREGRVVTISHNGSQEKTKTRMIIWPQTGNGLVVMTNSEYADPTKITKALTQALGF